MGSRYSLISEIDGIYIISLYMIIFNSLYYILSPP